MGTRLGCTGLLAILVLGWIRFGWSGRLSHKVCQTIRYGNETINPHKYIKVSYIINIVLLLYVYNTRYFYIPMCIC